MDGKRGKSDNETETETTGEAWLNISATEVLIKER